MEIYQLRYFLAVVETRNFSRAAERAFVSQPTLSAGIKKLELELEAKLFDRRTRNITLTEAGQRFLPRARTVIYECNAAKQDILRKTASQRLQIGVLRIIPTKELSSLLADFKKAHPDVQIAIKEGTSDQLYSWLEEGRINIALSTAPSGREKTHFEHLFNTKCVLAVSKSHPFSGRSSIPLALLNRLDFIHRSHCITEVETTRAFAREGINPHIVFRTDEDSKALLMTAAGLGLCMLPDIITQPGIEHIPVEGININRTIGLAYLKNNEDGLIHSFRLFATSHKWKPQKGASENLEWAR